MKRRRAEIVALCLFLAPFVLYFPVTLGQKVFFDGDISLFDYPIRVALASAFAQGRLPLWSPGMMMGFPLMGEGQIGALNPLNQILYRVLPAYRALGLEMLLHLGWMMVGTYYFARQIKLGIPSAALAAIVFAGNAYVMPFFPSLLATIAWLPWSLWLLEKLIAAKRSRARVAWFVLLCGTIVMQIFSAHPYHELFNAGMLMVYATAWRWRQSNRIDPHAHLRWWQPPGLVIAAVLIALGIGAVQLIPTFELSQVSNRARLTYDEFTIYSVELQHLLLLVAPFAQGGVYGVPGGVVGYLGILPLLLALIAPIIRRHRETLFWAGLAFGGLALAFGRNNPFYALLYNVPLFNSFRIADRFLYFFVFAAAMLSAFALDTLIDWSPRIGENRNASRDSRRLNVAVLGMIALIGIEVILAYQFSLQDWQALWGWLPLVLVLFGAVLIVGSLRRRLAREALVLAVIGVTVFDLVAFAAVFLHSKNALIPVDEFLRTPQSLAAIDSRAGQARVMAAGSLIPPFPVARESLFPYLGTVYGADGTKGVTSFFIQRTRDYTDYFSPGMLNLANVRYLTIPKFPPDETGRIVSQPSDKFALRLGKEKIDLPPTPAAVIQVDSYLENGNAAEGTPAGRIVFSFDDGTTVELALRAGIETADWAIERAPGRRAPPIARTFSAFAGARFQGHTYRARLALPQTRVVTALQVVAASDSLRIEHIRLIDDRGGDTLVDYFVGASDHSVVFRSDQTTVIENADALPRAFLIHAAEILDDAATLARLRAYTFDPRQVVLLADGDARADASPEQADDESVEIVAYQPEHVELAVTAKRQGYVILSDTWYPGWTAWLDGKPTALYRADYTFRAVKVDAGTHKIEFDYAPMSFYLGAAISVTTLMVLVLGATWMKRKS